VESRAGRRASESLKNAEATNVWSGRLSFAAEQNAIHSQPTQGSSLKSGLSPSKVLEIPTQNSEINKTSSV